ncbi:MarR family transcriptional regulator [Lachnospiraceae bacterium NSJ-143]|nr:MarR family transcriptional regulator [Lachnospiraceae bacterium NSJ-143]
MDRTSGSLNGLIVDIYNSIGKAESKAFKSGRFKDVSITEIHTVEAIGMYEPKSMSYVARSLRITVGTLTVAVNNLVKKGYVERFRCEEDKRVVKVRLTGKGRLLYRVHAQFHLNMIKNCTESLTDEEVRLLYKTLKKLSGFIKDEYAETQKPDSK